MAILVVGSVAFDSIETPSGKAERCLGGAATYFSLAASYFTDVRVIAVVGEDFTAAEEDVLKRRGVDTRGIEHRAGKSFFWRGSYLKNLNEAQTHETQLNVFETFSPKIPAEYADSEFLFLANIDPVLQENVRSQMPRVKMVCGDTMNYWINETRDELLATIRNWDFLLINDSEARLLSGETNLRKAADKILNLGPSTLVIKRGEYGAMLFRRDTLFMVPGYLLEDVFDPTGAGDCFAGGFVGYLAERGFDLRNGHFDIHELHRAVIYGSVMGSFCCEEFGVDRFRTLTRKEIDSRFEEFRRFTAF